MAKYRKKTIVVKAKQWKIGDPPFGKMEYEEREKYYYIVGRRVYNGDWIVYRSTGITEIVTAELFPKEYELIIPDIPKFKVIDTVSEREADLDSIRRLETWAAHILIWTDKVTWALEQNGILFLTDGQGNNAYPPSEDRFKVEFSP